MLYIVYCIVLDEYRDSNDDFFKPEIIGGFTKIFDDLSIAKLYVKRARSYSKYIDASIYDAEWECIERFEHDYIFKDETKKKRRRDVFNPFYGRRERRGFE